MSEAPGKVGRDQIPGALTFHGEMLILSPNSNEISWNTFGGRTYMLRFPFFFFFCSLNNTNSLTYSSVSQKSDTLLLD